MSLGGSHDRGNRQLVAWFVRHQMKPRNGCNGTLIHMSVSINNLNSSCTVELYRRPD